MRAIIEDAAGQRGYARAVLRYCGLAHFQAVADEFLYLLKNVLQRSTTVDLAEHLSRVFGIGTGSPTINVASGSDPTGARLRAAPLVRRSHFALAFGEDVHGEQGSPNEASAESRKTAVREAFNSPFWPFVLATTSAGQEGLDFHLYCRDIVHWNLPSNPVDLEQREGRINRRDGFAIRRSIARDWPLERVAALTADLDGNVWSRVFEALARDPLAQPRHGLYPHWLYDPTNGPPERIRRHLFFYENSQDALRYAELKERLALYRLVFGQPRQQDLLDRIEQRIATDADRTDVHRKLTRYMINLSPLRGDSARRRAREAAAALVKSPASLEALIAHVERLEVERAHELREARAHLAAIKNVVIGHLKGRRPPQRSLEDAVYALSYLRDPYDAVFDVHEDLGLEDDCELLNAVAERIRRRGEVN